MRQMIDTEGDLQKRIADIKEGKRREWKMRVKIIDACINGMWMSTWKDKMVDLYYPDERGNYWSIENVKGEKRSYFFSGNVFINCESTPQGSKLARYGGQQGV